MVVLAVERGQPAVSEQSAQTTSTPEPEEVSPQHPDRTVAEPDATESVQEAADAETSPEPETVEPEATEAPAELETDKAPADEPEAPEAPAEPVAPPEAPDAPAAPESETPAAPKPSAAPSPTMFAGRKAAVPAAPASRAARPAAPAAPVAPLASSESIKHGRVGEDGTVYVIAADGSEREVGSYPDATAEEALAYFARKFDEVVAVADLLAQRVAHTDVSAHEARQSLAHLKEQIGEATFVGDLASLQTTVTSLEESIAAKSAAEAEVRAAAKAAATVEREALVAEAEALAATDPSKVQWKQASTRIRELLDEWKAHQRSGPRLDKETEGDLWKRFSHTRTAFDKGRKAWFAQLDVEHGSAKAVKEKLVKEAEALSASKDWGATAGAFKRLMQDWKRAGRAARSDDDALWKRFKAAQDTFFDAKDEVVAVEEAEFSENLKVKETLLEEAEALKLDAPNLDAAKTELRRIQDKWEAAGKVPRNDVRRVENRLRAVEQKIRDIEDRQWQKSDPELTARAASMAEQLERAVQGLTNDLEAATAAGDDKVVAALQSELATKKIWLESARGNLS